DQILRGREVAAHEAEVGRTGADVDDERVLRRIDLSAVHAAEAFVLAKSHRREEGLGDDEETIEEAGDRGADRLLALGRGVRRRADDAPDLIGLVDADEIAKMRREEATGFEIVDEAFAKRALEVEVQAVLDRLLA